MSIEVLKEIWPEWQVEEKPLGKGSFGSVYKMVRRDHNIESFSALKVISIPTDPAEINSLRDEGLGIHETKTYLQGIVDDFIGEIQLMETLKGVPNIVSVEDYKVVEKTEDIGWDIYIRMELLTPFSSYVSGKKLTEKEIIKIGCDICTALEICGKLNIIHRDIKPENIFVNDFGYFKLGDFGIARKMENLSGGLSQKGTFSYMAPEVANSHDYDARVDIYSLGIVLYRLLNGNRFPFLTSDEQFLDYKERKNAIDRRLRGDALPPPCDASKEMADIILRACAYSPEDRFATATELKEALTKLAVGDYEVKTDELEKTVSVRKPIKKADDSVANEKRAVDNFGKTNPKTKLIASIVAVVVGVALLVGGVFLFLKSRENRIEITRQPEDISVEYGKLGQISVDAEGEDLTYEWWVSDPGDTEFFKSTQKTNTYKIEMDDPVKDGRKAYCVVLDGDGNSVQSETVVISMITPEIKIVTQPQNAVVENGQTVSVSVVAEGEALTYEWWVSDPGDEKFFKSSQTTATYKLVMDDPVKNGRKAYCKITDKFGTQVTTNIIKITMK